MREHDEMHDVENDEAAPAHHDLVAGDGDGAAAGEAEHVEQAEQTRERGRRSRSGRRHGGGLRSLLDGVLKPVEPMSRADAELEAAREIEAAAVPAMERLVRSVPGAADPDDALARLEDSLPPRDVPSEPAPAPHLHDAEVAHTLALYQVRHHLKTYRFPTPHESELARRLNVRTGSGVRD